LVLVLKVFVPGTPSFEQRAQGSIEGASLDLKQQVQIPIDTGQIFRRDAGHDFGVKPDTIPR
jgi:hypothetical protein